MLSIAHVEGRWQLQSLTRTGQRTQIHCTAAGKAVLAFLPADACDDLIARLPLKRYTPRTIVKASALKMELMRVRSAGFATDDEELEEGLRCVGAPIFDHHARVIGSLSIAAPVFRLRKERLAEVALDRSQPRLRGPPGEPRAVVLECQPHDGHGASG